MVGEIVLFKGTLLGGTVGVLLTLWLSIGSMTMRYKHPPLPPLSLENCSLRNSNSSFHTSTLNYDNYTYFEVNDGIWTKNNWTQTTEVMPDAKNQVVS